jgi:hypothetical protein
VIENGDSRAATDPGLTIAQVIESRLMVRVSSEYGSRRCMAVEMDDDDAVKNKK